MTDHLAIIRTAEATRSRLLARIDSLIARSAARPLRFQMTASLRRVRSQVQNLTARSVIAAEQQIDDIIRSGQRFA